MLRGLLFGFLRGPLTGDATNSVRSPKVLALEWVEWESPDTDLSSSSSLLPGYINEVERSSGVSAIKKKSQA